MRRGRKSSKAKKKSLNINLKQVVFILLVIVFIGYTVFFAITFTGVQITDPTESNGSQYYLLSQNKDSFKKTLWVFEKGLGDDRKIDKVYMHLYNQEKKKSLLVYVPGWIYSSGLEEDFGNAITVSSFRYAGDFLQEDRGIEYALWQINQMLGIKVDDYIWFTTEALNSYEEIYGEIKGSSDSILNDYKNKDEVTEEFLFFSKFLNSYSFLDSYFNTSKTPMFENSIYSNISFTTVLDNIRKVRKSLCKSETYAIDLESSNYSIEKLSDVGGMVNYFNSLAFDKKYRELISTMIDRELEKERVRVEVYNGSGVSGAAGQFGRKVENSGCDVVRYENAPKIVEKTTIYISNKEDFKNSLSVVEEVLSGKYELIEGRPSFMTTGDIVIVLGQDIKLMYSF